MAFVAVHVFEVIVTGLFNNLRSMVTGWYRVPQNIQQTLNTPLLDGTDLRRFRLGANGTVWQQVDFALEADFSRAFCAFLAAASGTLTPPSSGLPASRVLCSSESPIALERPPRRRGCGAQDSLRQGVRCGQRR